MRIYRGRKGSKRSRNVGAPRIRRAGGAQWSQERTKAAIERFNLDHDILDVLSGSEPAYVAATNGGEYASTEGCPACGEGHDRLRIWPKHPTKGAFAWCRQCRNSGDALKWMMLMDGLDPSPKGATTAFLREHGYLQKSERHSPKPTRAVATNVDQGCTVQQLLAEMERAAGRKKRRRKTSAPSKTPDTPDSQRNTH